MKNNFDKWPRRKTYWTHKDGVIHLGRGKKCTIKHRLVRWLPFPFVFHPFFPATKSFVLWKAGGKKETPEHTVCRSRASPNLIKSELFASFILLSRFEQKKIFHTKLTHFFFGTRSLFFRGPINPVKKWPPQSLKVGKGGYKMVTQKEPGWGGKRGKYSNFIWRRQTSWVFAFFGCVFPTNELTFGPYQHNFMVDFFNGAVTCVLGQAGVFFFILEWLNYVVGHF